MPTIREFIDYLQQYPQDTQIMVMKNYDGNYCTMTKWVEIDLENCSDNLLYLEQHNALYIGDE